MKDYVRNHQLQETSGSNLDFKYEDLNNNSSKYKRLLRNIVLLFPVSILIVCTCIYTYVTVEKINEPVRSLNKNYKWPCIFDFVHLIWQLPLTIVLLFI